MLAPGGILPAVVPRQHIRSFDAFRLSRCQHHSLDTVTLNALHSFDTVVRENVALLTPSLSHNHHFLDDFILSKIFLSFWTSSTFSRHQRLSFLQFLDTNRLRSLPSATGASGTHRMPGLVPQSLPRSGCMSRDLLHGLVGVLGVFVFCLFCCLFCFFHFSLLCTRQMPPFLLCRHRSLV